MPKNALKWAKTGLFYTKISDLLTVLISIILAELRVVFY